MTFDLKSDTCAQLGKEVSQNTTTNIADVFNTPAKLTNQHYQVNSIQTFSATATMLH